MKRTHLYRARESAADRGFGLIEIVVSMFLLGLLAIATLPLLIQSMAVASKNATIASATQVVEQQLEQLRASGSSCSAVKTLVAATPATVPERGVSLQPHLQLILPASPPDVCQAPYLRTVPVRVWVTVAGSTTVLAEATKLVLLDTP
ncbi:MAG: type secretion system protein [Microbacteriaceae bacterium]|nr:type secretion system protein [Microbacteriaceae bacterium]